MHDIHALTERAKELRCLYSIDAIVSARHLTPASIFMQVTEVIPPGWQFPETTGARIEYLGRSYVGPGFLAEGRVMSRPITLWGREFGRISVSDHGVHAMSEDGEFLPEEGELLQRIACRLAEYLEWKHTELLGELSASGRDHWAWRQRFAEALADSIDAARFGVARLYIGGSTARGDAGPGSDIDLYIHCVGTEEQRKDLALWMEGWSRCLGEVALQQTGQPFPDGILNVQWLNAPPDAWQRAELQELELGGRAAGQ